MDKFHEANNVTTPFNHFRLINFVLKKTTAIFQVWNYGPEKVKQENCKSICVTTGEFDRSLCICTTFDILNRHPWLLLLNKYGIRLNIRNTVRNFKILHPLQCYNTRVGNTVSKCQHVKINFRGESIFCTICHNYRVADYWYTWNYLHYATRRKIASSIPDFSLAESFRPHYALRPWCRLNF